MNNQSKILITGAAGFIGYHLSKKLLNNGNKVFGIDNLNSYYDLGLKHARLNQLKSFDNFEFQKIDIVDYISLNQSFQLFKPEKVVNLAAQAGVRYSLENPQAYIDTNVTGFMNILECCRHHKVDGLIYASSSSVYGENKKVPFSVQDRVAYPISIYAASKRSNELMAHTYSNLFGLHTTGLRYFTVYGAWGRPDMAYFIFAKNILFGEPIFVYNHGEVKRDFTYIDDIIAGTVTAIEENEKCELFNLGNNKCIDLMDIITIIEDEIGKKADIRYEGMQLGDVEVTYADIEYSQNKLGYIPRTSISEGISIFVEWLKSYYDI